MRANIVVTYRDGRVVTGPISAVDVMDMEDEFDISFNDFASNMRMKWLYWLAHRAMKHAHDNGDHEGAFKPALRGFVDIVDDVDLKLEGEEGGPTPLGETAASST